MLYWLFVGVYNFNALVFCKNINIGSWLYEFVRMDVIVCYDMINWHNKKHITGLVNFGIVAICIIVLLDTAVELNKSFKYDLLWIISSNMLWLAMTLCEGEKWLIS